MRLWSLHPSMLDTKGLVALWREALGAQKALYHYELNEPVGYQHHPQLERFKQCQNPLDTLIEYMLGIKDEATQRGYKFDGTRILADSGSEVKKIPVTTGQIQYEVDWLRTKLLLRSPHDLIRLEPVTIHPLFYEVEGDIEPWERVKELI